MTSSETARPDGARAPSPIDPRTPCLVGWSQQTWPRTADQDAPEPLDMWEQVVRDAVTSSGASGDVLASLDSVQVLYTQSWHYDDPVGRLVQRLGTTPRHRLYSGIGGTTPQILVQDAATAMLRGETDAVVITSAEALHTLKRIRARGERPGWSFPDPEPKPFPFEAPFVPAEVAHEVLNAWLTFAMFDNARRARRREGLEEHRRALAGMWHRFSTVAAANPRAWFGVERTVEEILTVTPANRMVGYPYTKYMVSVMDVDMAAALVLTTQARADELGVPADRRVYLRGWGAASDPQAVAAHRDMWRSPALAAAADATLTRAGLAVDDIGHLDLYSCFGSSVDFARDALGLADDDPRPLTVTGGLPYFGGPGSGYMTHSIATMADRLRDEPGSHGLVTGVGMHMTKHVVGVYSTTPGPVAPPEPGIQDRLDAAGHPTIVDAHEGTGTVAAYSVAHDREGPTSGVVVVDVGDDARAYARITEPDLLADAEERELVGRTVEVTTDGTVNTARW